MTTDTIINTAAEVLSIVPGVSGLSTVLTVGNNSLGQKMVIGTASPVTPVQQLEVPGANAGTSIGSRWVGTSGNVELSSFIGKPASDGSFAGTGQAYIQFVERQLDTDATNGRKGTRMDFHIWDNSASTNTFVMCIAANGNVGIGPSDLSGNVAEPYAKLLVNATVAGVNALRLGATVTGNVISVGGTSPLGIDAPGVPNGRFFISSTGNVGINNTSPTEKLHINGNLKFVGSPTISASAAMTVSSTTTMSIQAGSLLTIQSGGASNLQLTSSGTIQLTAATNGVSSSHLLITDSSSQNFVVNHTTPGYTGELAVFKVAGGTKMQIFGTGGATLNGNLTLNTLGNKFLIKEGANSSMGIATLGVGGIITVANTLVTANSRIFLTTQSPGGSPGALYISSVTAGVSFDATSTNAADLSTFAWIIIEPA